MNKLVSMIIILFLLGIGIVFFINDNDNKLSLKDEQILVKNGAGKGYDLYVPAHPKKVIFLNSSSLDLWLGAGGANRVHAYVKFPTLPERIIEKMDKNTLVIGTSLNINPEIIAKEKPDLVVANSTSKAQAVLGETLKKFNIPLLTIHNESLEDTYFELNLYGRMTGNESAAIKEIERMQNKIKIVADSYKGLTKPKAVIILGTTNSFSMLLPNSRQGNYLLLAGGENIADVSNSPDIYSLPLSLEYLAHKDPDYIFFVSMGPEEKIISALKKSLQESSAWRVLRAVKEDKVFILPTELFSSHYGLLSDEAVVHLNSILYNKN